MRSGLASSAPTLGCPQCSYKASGEQSLAVHLADVHGLAMAMEAVPRARAIARDAERMSRRLVKLAAVGAPGSPASGGLDEEEVDVMAIREARSRSSRKPGAGRRCGYCKRPKGEPHAAYCKRKDACPCGGISRHKPDCPRSFKARKRPKVLRAGAATSPNGHRRAPKGPATPDVLGAIRAKIAEYEAKITALRAAEAVLEG